MITWYYKDMSRHPLFGDICLNVPLVSVSIIVVSTVFTNLVNKTG